MNITLSDQQCWIILGIKKLSCKLGIQRRRCHDVRNSTTTPSKVLLMYDNNNGARGMSIDKRFQIRSKVTTKDKEPSGMKVQVNGLG